MQAGRTSRRSIWLHCTGHGKQRHTQETHRGSPINKSWQNYVQFLAHLMIASDVLLLSKVRFSLKIGLSPLKSASHHSNRPLTTQIRPLTTQIGLSPLKFGLSPLKSASHHSNSASHHSNRPLTTQIRPLTTHGLPHFVMWSVWANQMCHKSLISCF